MMADHLATGDAAAHARVFEVGLQNPAGVVVAVVLAAALVGVGERGGGLGVRSSGVPNFDVLGLSWL